MKATITARFEFAAAHRLPRVPDLHKCSRVHGHNWKVALEFTGTVKADKGWIVDFFDIEHAWNEEVHQRLDHRFLNDVEGLDNPTSEVLAEWIFSVMAKPFAAMLKRVTVWETEGFSVSYPAIGEEH